MLAEQYRRPLHDSFSTTPTDAVRTSGDIEDLLRRRVRHLARCTRVGPSGSGPGFVAGMPTDLWRRLILGWLSDSTLGARMGREALAGARLAIQDFNDGELRSYLRALIEVDP